MTTFFVTRHPGALEWATKNGVVFDTHCIHLDPSLVEAGDTVIGSLPVHLAVEVCARGARYLNLTIDLPADLRGRELDAATLDTCRARIEEFHVEKLS